jgi:hypothetical protein
MGDKFIRYHNRQTWMKETTLNIECKWEDREDGVEMDFMEVECIVTI